MASDRFQLVSSGQGKAKLFVSGFILSGRLVLWSAAHLQMTSLRVQRRPLEEECSFRALLLIGQRQLVSTGQQTVQADGQDNIKLVQQICLTGGRLLMVSRGCSDILQACVRVRSAIQNDNERLEFGKQDADRALSMSKSNGK